MNNLPDDFQFSQGNIQDFVDCRRRFQLRYILRLAWPAIETEPVLENERYLQRGALFHRLVHQHLLGVSSKRLAGLIHDKDLERWWTNYTLFSDPDELAGFQSPSGLYPEISLSAPLGENRLVAKYDLVLLGKGGRATIVDWKTSRRRPRRSWLNARLQTRVYPYLLVHAGAHLNTGEPIDPEGVEMVYWFTEYPDRPARFVYSLEKYAKDEAYLSGLIESIRTMEAEIYPLTSDEKRCTYCVYRSLCDRGVKAGDWEEVEEDLEGVDLAGVSLDFEQIAEIEF